MINLKQLAFRSFRQSESELYSEKSFYSAFLGDMKLATSSLVIESPFITYRRATYLLPELVRTIDRGVSVTLNTRNPAEHEGSMQEQARAVTEALRNMGVTVTYTNKLHRKLAIVDKSILWEGSLNILSQSRSCEIMRRTVNLPLSATPCLNLSACR